MGRSVSWIGEKGAKRWLGYVAQAEAGGLVKVRPNDRRQRPFWSVLGEKVTLEARPK